MSYLDRWGYGYQRYANGYAKARTLWRNFRFGRGVSSEARILKHLRSRGIKRRYK